MCFTTAAWVATEFFRGYLFGGFPWVPLGNSQVTVLPVAQLASILGVYGLSALVSFVSAAWAYALLTTGRRRFTAVAAIVVVLGTVAGWGTRRIADGSLTREGTPLRVGLVQGNIPQDQKWKTGEARRIFTTYIAMTRDVVGWRNTETSMGTSKRGVRSQRGMSRETTSDGRVTRR